MGLLLKLHKITIHLFQYTQSGAFCQMAVRRSRGKRPLSAARAERGLFGRRRACRQRRGGRRGGGRSDFCFRQSALPEPLCCQKG
ncbi:hypothetical protein HMPREF0262_00571 [Clostridium sp. ATCC 29733]|nr:hypothetical protein HMPREF0262_00571 [Clostridium sp. ATCC 29733]